MSTLEKDLLPDEQIIYRTKKSYIVFFMPVVWILAAIGLLMTPEPLVHKAAAVPFFIAIITGFNQWLDYLYSDYAVTNKRILMREGFFYRHRNETRIAAIANVSVDQSLLGQLLNYGTVFIHAFGGDKDPFDSMDNPNEFQKQLQIQQDKVAK